VKSPRQTIRSLLPGLRKLWPYLEFIIKLDQPREDHLNG
jgi:hypothetical protein